MTEVHQSHSSDDIWLCGVQKDGVTGGLLGDTVTCQQCLNLIYTEHNKQKTSKIQ